MDTENMMSKTSYEEATTIGPVGTYSNQPAHCTALASWFITLRYSVLTVTALVALAGNILVITVIALSRQLHSLTSVFVTVLAVCDLGITMTLMPSAIAADIIGHGWLRNTVACNIFGFCYVMFRLGSVLSLSAISVDRCAAITNPLKYSQLITARRVGGFIFILSLLVITMAVLPIAGYGKYNFSCGKGLCAPQYTCSIGYTILLLVLGVTIPLLVTLSMYLFIGKAAMKKAKKGNIVCDENHCRYVPNKKGELKIVQMLFIITGVFFLCWMPYIVVNLWQLGLGHSLEPYTDAVTEWLSLLSAALNPWLYSLLNRTFRANLSKLWCKFKKYLSTRRTSISTTGQQSSIAELSVIKQKRLSVPQQSAGIDQDKH